MSILPAVVGYSSIGTANISLKSCSIAFLYRFAHRIAFTGGTDVNDHRAIWDRLDRVHAKHSDLVLMQGGSQKGAERIAAAGPHRRVTQIDRIQKTGSVV